MTSSRSKADNVEIVLIEDNASDVLVTLNALKKASICNKIHVLKESVDVMDFLLRAGRFAGEPHLPAETVVLLSLNLSGIHGLDLLRKIKEDERTKHFPVILLSSSQEERGVMEGYKIGANACIVKPVDLAKIVEAASELHLGWLLISPGEADLQ